MRIGIPQALLFHRYEPFIKTFFNNLGVDTVYSGPSNRQILEGGIRDCVDEACLPMKIFQGHVSKLAKECDKVVVPRLMKCEFGDSICPKFSGLPELIGRGSNENKFAFTGPLYLNNKTKLKNALISQGKEIKIPKAKVLKAFQRAEEVVTAKRISGISEGTKESELAIRAGRNQISVGVLGHPYNISDDFANMNMISKLGNLGITVITGEDLTLSPVGQQIAGLMKKPYWMFYRENLVKAGDIVKKGTVDGIIYISSFCCGTDSIIIEMIRSRIGDFPMLVLKVDEHTAEAGIDTRIEAFVELLERRRL